MIFGYVIDFLEGQRRWAQKFNYALRRTIPHRTGNGTSHREAKNHNKKRKNETQIGTPRGSMSEPFTKRKANQCQFSMADEWKPNNKAALCSRKRDHPLTSTGSFQRDRILSVDIRVEKLR